MLTCFGKWGVTAMELWRGKAHSISTCAEFNRGQGWCSVAYFKLDDKPVRLVCETLKPSSRTPLSAPFAEGDDVIVFGRVDAKTSRMSSRCCRLVRQGRTLDQSQAATIICGGLALTALGLYPALQFLFAMFTAPAGNIGPALAHDTGLLPLMMMMTAGGVLGLGMLGVGFILVKARRTMEAAAR